MSSEALQQAYRLIREGNKPEAAELLLPIVRAEPLNADAWWLLANAVDNPNQQARALKHVLSLRPNDERATQMLDRLQALASTTPASSNNLPFGDVSERRSRPVNLILVFIGVLAIISCAVCLGLAAISGTQINAMVDGIVLTVTAMPQSFAPIQAQLTAVIPTAIPTVPPDLNMQGSVSLGQTVSSTLPAFQDDGWTFSGKAKQQITFEVDALDPKLDPRLYLYAPGGQLIDQNDDIDAANNRNARIEITLPTSGTYTIRIGKYADGGQYRLIIQG